MSNLTSNLLAKNYVKTKKYLLNLTPQICLLRYAVNFTSLAKAA